MTRDEAKGRGETSKIKPKRKSKASTAVSSSSAPTEDESLKKAPHSFIFHRGKVGRYIRKVIRDLRRLMEPYTAMRLKANKKNVLKDFIAVAGPLGVTHLIVFTRTEEHVQMRLIRVPRGPTLTFRVQRYALARDILSSLKKQASSQGQYHFHPLIVMNNFKVRSAENSEDGHGDGRHISLMQTMLQNMFPTINTNSVQLKDIRRCVLFNYDQESDTVEWRHYAIKVAPTGLSRSVKKLLPNRKKIPNLSRYKDISDYFLTPGQLSESEFEADGQNEVELPQDVPGVAGCERSSEVAIRLVELGPRLTLQLIKVETGVSDGEVLYHKFIKKSNKQIAKQRKKLMEKRKLKDTRRKEQEENIKRKRKQHATGTKNKKARVDFENVGKVEVKEEDIENESSKSSIDKPKKRKPRKIISTKVKRASA